MGRRLRGTGWFLTQIAVGYSLIACSGDHGPSAHAADAGALARERDESLGQEEAKLQPVRDLAAWSDKTDHEGGRLPGRLKMVPIPAGWSYQGCTLNEKGMSHCPVGASYRLFLGDIVYIEAFEIAKYETTVGEYLQCVKRGACTAIDPTVAQHPMFCNTTHADLPVVCATWQQARQFCAWTLQGGRLPTAHEWEKAARGNCATKAEPKGGKDLFDCVLGATLYPWGNEPLTCELANFMACWPKYGHPVPVGSMPHAASRTGVLDLAGNVAEWTEVSGANEPPKTETVRGGSFRNGEEDLMTGNSEPLFAEQPATAGQDWVGFRCARSIPDTSEVVDGAGGLGADAE